MFLDSIIEYARLRAFHALVIHLNAPTSVDSLTSPRNRMGSSMRTKEIGFLCRPFCQRWNRATQESVHPFHCSPVMPLVRKPDDRAVKALEESQGSDAPSLVGWIAGSETPNVNAGVTFASFCRLVYGTVFPEEQMVRAQQCISELSAKKYRFRQRNSTIRLFF